MDKIIHIGQEIMDITEGNQKWHGGIPNLVTKPKISSIYIKSELHIKWLLIKKVIDPNKISLEPKAWARKYFIEASVSLNLFEEDNKGIKDIKFNSNPNQIKIQLFLLRARTEPRIKEEENKVVNGI